MEKLLSVHEAAALLGLSPRTLYNLVARDQIPFQRVRRRVMFRPSALERWLDAQVCSPEARVELPTLTERAMPDVTKRESVSA